MLDKLSFFLFRGQIESPAKSLSSLIINEDTEVLVAINTSGLYVIDPVISLDLSLQMHLLSISPPSIAWHPFYVGHQLSLKGTETRD